jgi:Holliday junction DNA helicase RuvB
LDYYCTAELTEIVVRSAGIIEVEIDSEGAAEIASRSRGTPRIANRLLKRVRDYVQVRADGVITAELAHDALLMFGVDEAGLDQLDQRLLTALITKFGGAPVGLNTLAMALGEEAETIEDVYEPYLLQLGFLQRTPRGRVATDRAYDHLGLKVPPRE